jgi:hypothetical protein
MTLQDFLDVYNIHYWRSSDGIGWLISNKQTGEAKGFGFDTYTTDAEFQFYTGRELQIESVEFLWPFIQKSYNITIESIDL